MKYKILFSICFFATFISKAQVSNNFDFRKLSGFNYQSAEECNFQKAKIDSLFTLIPKPKMTIDGKYTKINSHETLIIDSGKIIEQSTFYPFVNSYVEASSYNIRRSNATTISMIYKFTELKNDTLFVFGEEKNEQTNYQEIYGSKSANSHRNTAIFHKDFLEIKFQEITDKIIVFNGIYYIREN